MIEKFLSARGMKRKDHRFRLHASRFTLHVSSFLGLLLFLFVLSLLPALVLAQSPPVIATPTSLTLTGSLDNGPLAASLRLTASAPVTNIQIIASDLQDVTGDGRFRDAIPGNKVTVLPAAQITTLVTNSLTALAIQVEPPAQAGTYSGTLTIRWQEPEPGELNLPLTVNARTRPNLTIQNPSQLTVNAEPGQRITRQIVLHETVGGSPVTGLRTLPQDLLTANSGAAIPAQAISLTVPSVITGGQIATASMGLDLTNASAGAYSGNILFTTPLGEVLTLPVMVNVKHSPLLPLLVLFVGVGLGIWLTTYQEKGKPRDQVVVRIAAVRQAITDDPELTDESGPAQGFRQALEQHLTIAESKLRADDWPGAADAMTAAETVLDRWRGLRPAWLAVLNYLYTDLQARLNQDGSNMLRRLGLVRQTLLQTAPSFAGPVELRTKIAELEDQLLRYEYLRQLLQQAGQLRTTATNLSDQEKEQWRQEEISLQGWLMRLLPEEEAEWDRLETELQTLIAQRLKTFEEVFAKGRAAPSPVVPVIAANVPDVGRMKPITPEEGQSAQAQLKFFTGLAYVIGGIILIWAGYIILYVDQPTFGAHPTDYLTLFTWGLGGQTAFATVANRLIGWGLGRAETQS